MKKFKYCLWGIFLPIMQATAQQQPISPAPNDNIIIKGRVLNEQGESLAGASVSVKNGKKSTITNEKGLFEIKNITPNSVLLISYTGYKQKEIPVNGQTTLDIRLI